MSGMWKRSHGRTSEAPPDERGGYRYVRPTATAPHLDSTLRRRWCAYRRWSAIHPSTVILRLPSSIGAASGGRAEPGAPLVALAQHRLGERNVLTGIGRRGLGARKHDRTPPR